LRPHICIDRHLNQSVLRVPNIAPPPVVRQVPVCLLTKHYAEGVGRGPFVTSIAVTSIAKAAAGKG
jgi:hypothetical protein